MADEPPKAYQSGCLRMACHIEPKECRGGDLGCGPFVGEYLAGKNSMVCCICGSPEARPLFEGRTDMMLCASCLNAAFVNRGCNGSTENG